MGARLDGSALLSARDLRDLAGEEGKEGGGGGEEMKEKKRRRAAQEMCKVFNYFDAGAPGQPFIPLNAARLMRESAPARTPAQSHHQVGDFMEWIGGILLTPPTPTHSLYLHPASPLNPERGWEEEEDPWK